MDRNTFTGLFLILVILVGSTYLLKPTDAELKRENQIQDSIKNAKSGKVIQPKQAPVSQPEVIDSSLFKGPFGAARVVNKQVVVLENENLKVSINSKGGKIESVELKNYQTYDKKPLIMFNAEDTKFGLLFNANGASINTNDLYFTASAPELKVAKSDSGSVTFRANYGPNQYLDYVYSLKGNSFKVGFNVIASGLENVISSGPVTLNWETVLKQKEKDLKNEHTYSGAYFNHADNEVDHIGTTEDEKIELGEDGKIKWFSFKQHFFSNVLISKTGFDKGTIDVSSSPNPGVVKVYAANFQLPFKKQAVNSYEMEFYFGPNQFKTLKAQGYDLERQIDLGWGPLKWVNRVAVLPVFDFLDQFNWSYGLIILVLTILLKVVLSPLTYKSYVSMAKMRVLKPEMDEIKAKVGDDNPTLLQQEYLKLYKKAGVNPLGGCIPMLLQMPIIMAFFFFFPNLFELRGESFLWMDDLSTYDSIINFPTIPLLGINHISLMCLLMTVSTLIYTYYNNQISGVSGQMKYIGYITPIIFLGVLNSYPAGLNYYYFLANMLTFAQQFIIKQMVDDDKIHARIQEFKKKPEGEKKKQSKFQQRMEEYMRQQQSQSKKK